MFAKECLSPCYILAGLVLADFTAISSAGGDNDKKVTALSKLGVEAGARKEYARA